MINLLLHGYSVHMASSSHLSFPPKVYSVSDVKIPDYHQFLTVSGVPVIVIPKRESGVVLIDMVFRAGRPQEVNKLNAVACGALMREGAGAYSSEALSEEIDFLGASINIRTSLDFISVKAVALKKHLMAIVNLLTAIVRDPHFGEDEWEYFLQKSQERLKLQLSKNDVLSYRKITEIMYGTDHPYGYNSSERLFNQLNLDHVKQHHQDFITRQNCQIFVAGDIEREDQKLLDGLTEGIRKGGKNGNVDKVSRGNNKPESIWLSGNPEQTSIRIGRLTMNRLHDDFEGLMYTSNILGGYFGSRLTSNIREKKGLTYSIFCILDNQVYDGDMIISTEVANENVKTVEREIYYEMERMCTELVNVEELSMVNNYMMGNYLNSFDGPFNSIRTIKSLALADIPLDNISGLIKSSLSFDAHQIRDIARKYFDRNDFWNVFVGIPQ